MPFGRILGCEGRLLLLSACADNSPPEDVIPSRPMNRKGVKSYDCSQLLRRPTSCAFSSVLAGLCTLLTLCVASIILYTISVLG